MLRQRVKFGCKAFVGLGLGLAVGVLSACRDDTSDANVEPATLAEVRSIALDKPGSGKLIDARTTADYAAGHIPTARNLDLAQVPTVKGNLDPVLADAGLLVVYGSNPGDGVAKAMVKRFLRAGQKHAKFFAGGIAEWAGAGLKLEKSSPSSSSTTAPPPATK